jgi:osmotically-inducible protein OsmY
VLAPPAIGGALSFSPAGVVADHAIVRTALRELGQDAVTGREQIGADSESGVLTLQGSVATRLAKARAVEIAHVVRGVRAIVDRIDVAAVPRPDYEIDSAVATLLARDPVTSWQRIDARARKGIVLLSGHVGSKAARRIAEADVLGVPGVVDAFNDLAVRPGGTTDERITAEVQRTVKDDLWLDDAHIRVATWRGVVGLEGWVGSAAERARAENDALASSPAGVDARGLRVDQFTDDGTLRAAPAMPRTDGDLQQALLDAFVRDPRVHPFAPTVEVRGGTVVLTGVAPNPHVVRAVDDDARALPGAAGVRDDLKTLPTVYSESDADIRTQVARAIARDPRLADGVKVEVLNGRVFLRGTVPSNVDRLRAIGIGTSPPGARDVDDGLVVVSPQVGAASRQPP